MNLLNIGLMAISTLMFFIVSVTTSFTHKLHQSLPYRLYFLSSTLILIKVITEFVDITSVTHPSTLFFIITVPMVYYTLSELAKK